MESQLQRKSELMLSKLYALQIRGKYKVPEAAAVNQIRTAMGINTVFESDWNESN
jgi:hypothetical protein